MFPERSIGVWPFKQALTQDLSQPPLSHTITLWLKLKVNVLLPISFLPSIPASYLRGVLLWNPHPEQIIFIGGTHSSICSTIISVLEPAESRILRPFKFKHHE